MYSFRERAPQNRPKRRHFETVGRHLYFGNGSEADDVTFDKLSSILYTKVLSMVHCVAVDRHKPSNNTKGVSFINYWPTVEETMACKNKASQLAKGIELLCVF